MSTATAMALKALVRAATFLRGADMNALADELECDVLALADEVDQLRTRAEAAEAELREVRRG
jgi:outer membrane murein-binding lipoprotein Lpp